MALDKLSFSDLVCLTFLIISDTTSKVKHCSIKTKKNENPFVTKGFHSAHMLS